MSDYPMLISNKLHSFRNFTPQKYKIRTILNKHCGSDFEINLHKLTIYNFLMPIFVLKQ